MTHEQVVENLSRVDSRCKSNTHRLDEMEKRQDNLEELVGSVKVLAVRQESVENDVREIKADVKTLSNKPAQRWDSIVDKLIYALLAALMTYLLARMGIS